MLWPAIRKTANNDSISRPNSRPKLPFPGKGNYKMPRKGNLRLVFPGIMGNGNSFSPLIYTLCTVDWLRRCQSQKRKVVCVCVCGCVCGWVGGGRELFSLISSLPWSFLWRQHSGQELGLQCHSPSSCSGISCDGQSSWPLLLLVSGHEVPSTILTNLHFLLSIGFTFEAEINTLITTFFVPLWLRKSWSPRLTESRLKQNWN